MVKSCSLHRHRRLLDQSKSDSSSHCLDHVSSRCLEDHGNGRVAHHRPGLRQRARRPALSAGPARGTPTASGHPHGGRAQRPLPARVTPQRQSRPDLRRLHQEPRPGHHPPLRRPCRQRPAPAGIQRRGRCTRARRRAGDVPRPMRGAATGLPQWLLDSRPGRPAARGRRRGRDRHGAGHRRWHGARVRRRLLHRARLRLTVAGCLRKGARTRSGGP